MLLPAGNLLGVPSASMTNVWNLTVRLYVDLRRQASGICPAQPRS
ncbi:hypothetical protein GA0074695_5538 [Micromonospora viridifaciens]|uniref:Uncharacterized protein n=1 Tax=Micromonospora viridifaciens TaxID=1881 RepID=A0A1C4ZGI2_MICVI|nr:hypothetical protein GA0074695_5538 [Micromonospora viridifaciens]